MRKAAVIGLLVPILVLAVFRFIPYLRGDAPVIDSTPAVQPLREATTVEVGPGDRLCVRGIVIGPESRFAQFTPEDNRRGWPALTVSASGSGFRSATDIPRAPRASGVLTAELDPPSSEVDGASVCLRNRGNFAINLFGVPPGLDSTVSETTVNGKPVPEDVALTLLKEPAASRTSNLPAMLERASTFVPVGPWALWTICALLVIGVPTALAVALARSCPGREG